MHLYYRNINDAFTGICRGFHTERFKTYLPDKQRIPTGTSATYVEYHPPIGRGSSRYGNVISIEEPVTITYTEPTERLLFQAARNCNPFFHLIEALWMLSGQCRVQPLSYFVKRMESFCDDDINMGDIPYKGKVQGNDFVPGVMWGAYGYRWRHWFPIDQIEYAIKALREDPTTRRVVIEMWDVRDLHRLDQNPQCKDLPCNLNVILRPRSSRDTHRMHCGQNPSPRKERVMQSGPSETAQMTERIIQDDLDMNGIVLLDMTVTNRSNDTLWGALGANYVHFSFLHEYIANAAGMGIGYYHQISNNLHIYENENGTWHEWNPSDLCTESVFNYSGSYNHYPLYVCPLNDHDDIDRNRREFDNACLSLFNNVEQIFHPSTNWTIVHMYFKDVVKPMLLAYEAHKKRDYAAAMMHCNDIVPKDWRNACDQWIRRVSVKYTQATGNGVSHVGN